MTAKDWGKRKKKPAVRPRDCYHQQATGALLTKLSLNANVHSDRIANSSEIAFDFSNPIRAKTL